MATVQEQYLSLVRAIDPKTKAGVAITSANVATFGSGARFSDARMLDFYNQARVMILEVLQGKVKDPDDLLKRLGGAVVDVSVAFDSSLRVVKPVGFVKFLGMTTLTINTAASVRQVFCQSATRMSDFRAGTDSYLVEGTKQIFVFDVGAHLKNIGTFIKAGDTGMLQYLGLANWAWADVTAGTEVEVMNIDLQPGIIEVAIAISKEVGRGEIIKVAQAFLGG
jgi:hypothetical protein